MAEINRLSDLAPFFAQEGLNDSKWVLIEHQLTQCKLSGQCVLNVLEEVAANPENPTEQELAEDCHVIVKGMVTRILDAYSVFWHYLSGTNVPDRISHMEV